MASHQDRVTYVISMRERSTIDLDIPAPAFRFWEWELRREGARVAHGMSTRRWRARRAARIAARSLSLFYWA
jgi:hypothetical protein